MKHLSSHVLRFSFVALFVWFGVMQLIQPGDWIGYLPTWTDHIPVPGEMIVMLNGWFEVVAAAMLAAGVFPRAIAGFLAVHLFGIAVTAGGATGVRDLALGMMGVAIMFLPQESLSGLFKKAPTA